MSVETEPVLMKHVPAVEALGTFINSTRYEHLPRSVQTASKMCLLDALAGVFAGHKTPPTRLALALAESLGVSGPATYWLSGAKGGIEDCAFVNSILVQSALLDDSVTFGHVGCVVPPSALVVGEVEGRTGAEVLTAIALGYETAARVDSQYFSRANSARGVRLSTAVVSFGVVAAAAYLMELPAKGIADALAVNVALCPYGTYEPMGKQGTSERVVQMAANAKCGVHASVLARAGFTGIDSAFEGEQGLYFTVTGRAEPPAGLLEGLGQLWHLDQVAVKPYPCGSGNTYPIYCAERLAHDYALKHEDISSVEVRGWFLERGSDLGRGWAGSMIGVFDPGPFENFEQALISCYFGVAATLVFGAFNVDVLLRGLGDPRVDALAQRMRFVPGLPPYTGWRKTGDVAAKRARYGDVTVTLRSGKILTASASDMPASMQRPDWDGMVARFHKLAGAVLSDEKREQIVREVNDLDKRPDCRALVAMLREAG